MTKFHQQPYIEKYTTSIRDYTIMCRDNYCSAESTIDIDVPEFLEYIGIDYLKKYIASREEV